MQIRFFKPFDELAGKGEIHLKVDKPILVKELFGLIEKQIPSLQRYVKKENDEIQSFFVLFVRGDEILKMDECVRDDDVIKVLPPISGG
jgi:molybdopterin converting factor small subunit